MKSSFFKLFSIAAIIFSACNNNNPKSGENTVQKNDSTKVTSGNSENTGTVEDIISGYMGVKNSLANDNSNEAATAANGLVASVAKLNVTVLNSAQVKVFDEVKDDIKEHAEHIEKNGSNIAHQREHFDMLSQDVYDLVKTGKSVRELYKDYCPMYNDNKGASWLSEEKEIKNPYLGKKMPTCGEVKEVIKKS
jgi:hypothetical protein